MKKIKILIPLLILLFIIYNNSNDIHGNNIASAYEKLNLNEQSEVENAIIIKGIETGYINTENGIKTNNLSGLIIYDNSFNIKSRKKIINKLYEKENIIIKLWKKDKRWHLTPHLIKKGENLWSLAKKYNTEFQLIIKINGINEPNRLNPGNKILIPNRNGVSYKVSLNDTLIKIANKFNVKKESIILNNNIKKNIVKQGELLFIPDAVESEKKITKQTNAKTNNFFDIDEEEHAFSEKDTLNKNKIMFFWPIKGQITSAFGKRKNPVDNRFKFHCGLDISASIGTPVKASAGGEAIFSGWKKGYGRVIILKHADGYITVYAHNKKNIIQTGDIIKTGDTIALSGISGAVTGPHLHFEIRKYLTPLNPLRFLK